MSGIMDWVKSTLGMPEEEEDTNIKEFEPEKKFSGTSGSYKSTYSPVREEAPVTTLPKRSKVVNINTTAQLKVMISQPMFYEDAKEIIDYLRSKKPVVVNLENVDSPTAQKIVNIISGAVYALDGSMQKVSAGIILVVPNNMGIVGNLSDELKTQGLFDIF